MSRILGFSCLLACVTIAFAGQASVATRVAQADYPLGFVEVEGRFLISTNDGYATNYLESYDEIQHRIVSRQVLPSLWFGLAYDAGEKRIVASDGKSGVYVIPVQDGAFGQPKLVNITGCKLSAGLVLRGSDTVFVACNQNHEVVLLDLNSGEVRSRLRVGEFPFAIQALPENRIAVSSWGQSSVTVIDALKSTILAEVKVGSHPSQMILLADRKILAVACSDSDSVSLIQLDTLREVRRIDLRLPGGMLSGVQPNALAFHDGRLFVALSSVNALAVFRLEKEKDLETTFEGVLPVGAFPTALLYGAAAKALFIADGRNLITGPSAPATPGTGSFRYVGDILGGGIEALTDEEFAKDHNKMLSLADQIYGEQKPAARVTEHRPPIKYVFYVIKENRTYDQVLGDMPEGNGMRDLTLFGEKITPNHHALAREYILFDNFYVNGDVSADGHLWSTAAISTEYVNKLWPHEYSERLTGMLDAPYDGDAEHDVPVAVPQSGFLWDKLLKAHITFRNYGEWYSHDVANPSQMHAYLAGLKDHSDLKFRDDIGDITDQQRVDEWEREFTEYDKNGRLPRFSLIYLPSDHTVGTKPGYHTPTAMVADNDLALGRVVERISKSRHWARSAIFVLEDDAQDGPDHVDAHRSPMLVISPYTRNHSVSSKPYSTVSVVKTIEQILGLERLTYFDDRAPSLLREFAKSPTVALYRCRRPEASLDETNPPNAPGAKQSSQWDFRGPDRAPWLELNRVIWQSVKGTTSEPPAPVFQVSHLSP